jgi:hypothetical protein
MAEEFTQRISASTSLRSVSNQRNIAPKFPLRSLSHCGDCIRSSASLGFSAFRLQQKAISPQNFLCDPCVFAVIAFAPPRLSDFSAFRFQPMQYHQKNFLCDPCVLAVIAFAPPRLSDSLHSVFNKRQYRPKISLRSLRPCGDAFAPPRLSDSLHSVFNKSNIAPKFPLRSLRPCGDCIRSSASLGFLCILLSTSAISPQNFLCDPCVLAVNSSYVLMIDPPFG